MSGIIKKGVLGIVLLIAYSQLLYAGSLILSIDKNEGTVYDQFYLKVKITGSGSDNITLPEVQGLSYQEAGVSRSFNMINGSVSRSLEKTFIITVASPGTYTIPSISMKIDGKMVSSNSISLKVEEVTEDSSATNKDEKEQKNKDIFVERKVDKKSVYVGETIEVKSLFYYRTQVSDISSVGQGWSDNFSPIIEKKTRNYSLVRNGIEYNVVELTDVLLVTGTSSSDIPPFVVRAMIPEGESRSFGGMGFFDDFFSKTNTVPKVFTSSPIKINIKALPNPKPKNFSSLVGNFKINASLSDHEVKVGDTLTLSVSVEGQGSLEGLDEKNLGIKLDPSMKVYPDKPSFSRNDGTFISESKVFKFALVPTKPGKFKIEDIKLNVFVPKLGDYTDLVAEVGEIFVEDNPDAKLGSTSAGQDTPEQINKSSSKEDVKYLTQDIRDIKRKDNSSSQELSKDTYRMGIIINFIPLSLLIILLMIRISKILIQRQNRKKAKAYKIMSDRFSKILSQNSQDRDKILALKEAFIDFLSIKLGEEARSKTMEEIDSMFSSRWKSTKEFSSVLRQFDVAYYGTDKDISVDPQTVVNVLQNQAKLLK